MGKLIFDDKTDKFILVGFYLADKTLAAMSVDIERLSKQQVPVGPTKKRAKAIGSSNKNGSGTLKSSLFTKRIGHLKYRLKYNKVYARYQHEGGDGKRVVRNYSYPGKKKKFLEDPGNLIAKKFPLYAKKYLGNIKI